MPGAPRREDYDTVIRDLSQRVDRLERAARNPTIFLPNSATLPPSPSGGGLVYVQGGVLHYIGGSGTNTSVGPA